MASQVLSGASNASYTNNTGQNVRLIINYMSNVTSMTWAGVSVTASSTTIGKDIPVTTISSLSGSVSIPNSSGTLTGRVNPINSAILNNMSGTISLSSGTGSSNIRFTTTTSETSNNFPTELMLASGQSFSSVCGAYNAIVIKEDGT
jgi:hypothetical protein